MLFRSTANTTDGTSYQEQLFVMDTLDSIQATWRLGIAPAQARVGDLVCRIPKSMDMIIVRKASESDWMQVIGRAVSSPESSKFDQSSCNLPSIDLVMDLETAYALVT